MNSCSSRGARFRRPSLLIIGCGDVGLRVAKLLAPRWRVLALTSSPGRVPQLRAAGVVPLLGNLDQPETLHAVAHLAPWVLHLAPPSIHDQHDARTRALLKALGRAGVVQRLVYASTSGVYGDARGAWVEETRAVAPQTDRAQRRVDAEASIRRLARTHRALHPITTSILRVPGIYALDRENGNPIERARRGVPVLRREEDVYTNHIHADDLARACVAALLRGMPQRVVHVSDDSAWLMGDYMELVAKLAGVAVPLRISRAEAEQTMSPMTMSFWSESRRLDNKRLKRELRLRLRYPTPREGLSGTEIATGR